MAIKVRVDDDPRPGQYLLTGSQLENFVLSELARLAPHAQSELNLFHYRTRDGIEVDVVVERPDGTIAGLDNQTRDEMVASVPLG